MKKAILMTLAALGLAGMAQADYSVTLNSDYYKGLDYNKDAWVYVWTGGSTGQYNTASNWSYLNGTTASNLQKGSSNMPVSADPAFIGYDFNYVNGEQILTANDTAITVTAPSWMGFTVEGSTTSGAMSTVFLGKNVTIDGSSNGFSGKRYDTDTRTGSITFNFGDVGDTQSSISMGDFWFQPECTVTFEGTLDMTEDKFTYKLFESSWMKQNDGTWAANFDITDQYGQKLQFAEAGSENVNKAGYYWLEVDGVVDGATPSDFTVSIVAQATPEPTTATLSLLALAGLCARRRRK